MRKFVISMLLLISVAPALCAEVSGPTESVTVNGASLVGIWKFSIPQGFDFAFLSKTKWKPNVDTYCQIEEIRAELSVHCLGLRLNGKDVSRGTITISGRRIRMAWGSAWFYFAINGTLQAANNFDGKASVQMMGVSDDAPDKAIGTRLSLSENTPDKGGKSQLLARVLDEMAQGSFAAPPDAPAWAFRIPEPETLRSLGEVRAMIYLGEQIQDSVYDVEFSNGHLICGLHQATDNGLDQFDCG